MAIHPAPCEKVLDRPDEVDYDPLLLEDHPLRGYPRELPPGLDLFVQNWYHTIRKNWRERLFRAVCLLLIFLYVFISC